MEKATHYIFAGRRYCLKPALNEKVRSLCDLEPTSSEYFLGENMNESFEISQRELQTVTEFGKHQIKEQSSWTFIIKGRF